MAIAVLPGLDRGLLGAAEWDRLDAVAEVPERTSVLALDDALANATLARADVLLAGWGCPPLDATLLVRMPNLRFVALAAGSVKELGASSELWDRAVTVTSAAHANAVPVAEMTLAAIVFALKDAFGARDRFRQRRGGDTVPYLLAARGTYGRRIGLIGASRVGRLVIERLRALEVEVSVTDPYLDDDEAAALGVTRLPLEDLLAHSDVVSLHAPALAETRHLIAPPQLAAMRDGAWLVNTARGSLVDHDALLTECATGRLHAFLDVTDPEPLPAESGLWDLPNVVITPHIAGSLGSEVRRLGRAAVTEVERLAAGMPPLHPVRAADLHRIA